MAYTIALLFFLFFSFLLCLLIFAQEGRSTGIGAGLGGEAVHSVLGASSADILKKMTAYGAAIFLFCCILFSAWTSQVPAAVAKAAIPRQEGSR